MLSIAECLHSVLKPSDNVDNRHHCIEHSQDSQHTCLTLLLGNTDSLSTTTGSLCMLSTNTNSPVMSQSTMTTNLFQGFQILSHLVVQTVGKNLTVASVFDILLSIQEPVGDLVLSWVLDDCNDSLQFVIGEFSGTLCQINISLFADNV